MINASEVAAATWADGNERLSAGGARLSGSIAPLGNLNEGENGNGGTCLPTSGLMYITRTVTTTIAIKKIIPAFLVRRITVRIIPTITSTDTSPDAAIINMA